MAKRTYGITSGGDRSDYYTPPQGHDKHLSDTERAHSGQAGSKVRHGADAIGKLTVKPGTGYDKGRHELHDDQGRIVAIRDKPEQLDEVKVKLAGK